MEILLLLTVFLVIPTACAIGAYNIASGKGRNPALWGFLGFLFGLIGLLVIALLPAVTTRPAGTGRA